MYALILAGGKGERLRPLTDAMPKPMVPVVGRPILAHQVSWLQRAGVTHVVFLVGYLGHMVEEYFQDGAGFAIRAQYSYEEVPLGRGGAVKKGLSMLPDIEGPVIATNGDVITQADMHDLLIDFEEKKAANPRHMATILTAPMVSPYGIVDSDPSGTVRQFREKATLPYTINGGIYGDWTTSARCGRSRNVDISRPGRLRAHVGGGDGQILAQRGLVQRSK